jgi:hypothetical protein
MKNTTMKSFALVASMLLLLIVCTSQKTVKPKRFFLISYSIQTNETSSIGEFPCEVSGFPAKIKIVETISKIHNIHATVKTVVITNLFEFKSKQDYLDYNYSK